MRTTIEMAREAGLRDCTCNGTKGCLERFTEIVRADERARMAEQPAQQEPFGYFKAEPFGWTDCAESDEGAVALYERPQPAQRTWVGLTDEERRGLREWQKIQEELGPVWAPMMLYLYEAIEAKLKGKNT